MTPRRPSSSSSVGGGEIRPPRNAARRLAAARTVWLATVRSGGRPHLVPVWFAWVDGAFYVCLSPSSVKGRNLEAEPRVVVALQDGTKPLICEGRGETVAPPWPADVVRAFESRYAWKIGREREYTRLVRIRPDRWLAW